MNILDIAVASFVGISKRGLKASFPGEIQSSTTWVNLKKRIESYITEHTRQASVCIHPNLKKRIERSSSSSIMASAV